MEIETCPRCGETNLSRSIASDAGDGIGSTGTVTVRCHRCGYFAASVVDLSIPPGKP